VALWFCASGACSLLFVPALVVYLLFMGLQGRYFGRWLMPVVPLICILAAYTAIAAQTRWHVACPALRVPAAALLAGALLCAQGLVYSIHSGLVNSRADTRNITRAWLVAHVPRSARVVIEPVVPEEWGLDVGHPLATANGYRWRGFPVLRTERARRQATCSTRAERHDRELREAAEAGADRRSTSARLLLRRDRLAAVRARLVDPRRCRRRSPTTARWPATGRLVYEASPYANGSKGVAFNFDWSFDYYPLAYVRPDR
jgi:hypothetical protein